MARTAVVSLGVYPITCCASHLHSLEGLPYHLLSLDIIELKPTIDNPYNNFVL